MGRTTETTRRLASSDVEITGISRSRRGLHPAMKNVWTTAVITRLGLSFMSLGILLAGTRRGRVVKAFAPKSLAPPLGSQTRGFLQSLGRQPQYNAPLKPRQSPAQTALLAEQHRFDEAMPWRWSPDKCVTTFTSTRLYATPVGTETTPVETQQVSLSTGVTAEIMTCNPQASILKEGKPTLVFIHGSFHASWCWAKHFMPFFAQMGYPTAAMSLRGTGGTYAGEGVKKVQIQQHVNDITSFLHWLQEQQGSSPSTSTPPVLLAHSFGGLTIMKYLERLHSNKGGPDDSSEHAPIPLPLSGCCLMCSVPPSGNEKMTTRFLRRSLTDSYKLTVGFAMKKALTNKKLCRELFFGYDENNDFGISDDELEDIQQRFTRDTAAMIDLPNLAKQLPSKLSDDSEVGAVSFVDTLPPSMVLGATRDFVVDKEGVDETAAYFGLTGKATWVDSPHDIMLGSNWRNAADAVVAWLEKEVHTKN
jgi:pimeloyl-ACP methyl ester carboxylesterase